MASLVSMFLYVGDEVAKPFKISRCAPKVAEAIEAVLKGGDKLARQERQVGQRHAAGRRQRRVRVRDTDIFKLEATFGAKLPGQYVDFVKQYGFVKFGYDANDTRIFTVAYEGDGQRELRQATAAFLVSPERAVQTLENFTDKSDPDSEELPLIPDGYFPAANDNGQGLVLVELATGNVWYWRESAWRWGTEDNTRLGFVADDFDGFINALRPEIA